MNYFPQHISAWVVMWSLSAAILFALKAIAWTRRPANGDSALAQARLLARLAGHGRGTILRIPRRRQHGRHQANG